MAEFIRTSKTRVQGENSLSTKGSNNIRSTIENWLRHFANPELSLTEYRDETKYEEELLHPHRQGMGLFTFETSINCIQDSLTPNDIELFRQSYFYLSNGSNIVGPYFIISLF